MISLTQILASTQPGDRIYTTQSDRAAHTAAARGGVKIKTKRCVAVSMMAPDDAEDGVVECRPITMVTVLAHK